MIPYVTLPSLQLGPLELHAFGALSAAGILLGVHLAVRAVRRLGRGDPDALSNAALWGVGGGLVGAHLVHVLGYHPHLLVTEGPLVLLKFWDGISSMGGVLGGLLGFWWGLRRRGERLSTYTDALALGAAPGWAVARVGCFLAHDHPGVHTDFFLGVQFPDGVRHDLGLYEFLLLAVLTVALYTLARRPRTPGVLTGVLAVGYSVPRFFLDFLRARDVPMADGRILGLTPAQYVAVALTLLGVWLLVRAARGRGVGATARDTTRPERRAAA